MLRGAVYNSNRNSALLTPSTNFGSAQLCFEYKLRHRLLCNLTKAPLRIFIPSEWLWYIYIYVKDVSITFRSELRTFIIKFQHNNDVSTIGRCGMGEYIRASHVLWRRAFTCIFLNLWQGPHYLTTLLRLLFSWFCKQCPASIEQISSEQFCESVKCQNFFMSIG